MTTERTPAHDASPPRSGIFPRSGRGTGPGTGAAMPRRRREQTFSTSFPQSAAQSRGRGSDIFARDRSESAPHWSVPWSDLMMTMFVLFAVLYAFHASKPDQAAAGPDPGALKADADPVSAQVGPNGAEMERLYAMSRQAVLTDGLQPFASVDLVPDRAVRIVLTGDLLFDTGKADIKPQALDSLRAVGGLLSRTPFVVNVVGHTDDQPINTERFPSNWELSSARACQVARFLIEDMGLASERFYISGHASFQPVEAAATPPARPATGAWRSSSPGNVPRASSSCTPPSALQSLRQPVPCRVESTDSFLEQTRGIKKNHRPGHLRPALCIRVRLQPQHRRLLQHCRVAGRGVGGTLGAAFLSFRTESLVKVLRVVRDSCCNQPKNPAEIVEILVDLSVKSRIRGIRSLSEDEGETSIMFLRRGLGFLVDNYSREQIEDILSTEVAFFKHRRDASERVLRTMAQICPAFGLVGSIIGLIGMLAGVGETSVILATIPIALTSTLYGVVFANFLFLPFAASIRERTDHELLLQKIILRGSWPSRRRSTQGFWR